MRKIDQSIVVSYVGTVEGVFNTGTNILLKNVLYSHVFRENWLSVSKIVEAVLNVPFKGNNALIQKNGLTIAVAERLGNLFQLQINIKKNFPNITKNENGSLWHKRLGDISNGGLMNCLNIRWHWKHFTRWFLWYMYKEQAMSYIF